MIISKNQFINENPLGSVYKQNSDGSKSLLSESEYNSWVESSKGVWGDLSFSNQYKNDKCLINYQTSGDENRRTLYGIARNRDLKVTKEIKEDGSEFIEVQRCDTELGSGPTGFHVRDPETGQCNCGSPQELSDLTHTHITLFDIQEIDIVIGNHSSPAYIVKFSISSSSMRDEMVRQHWSAATETLQDCIKLLIEWHQAHEIFGCSDEIAVVSHAFFEELNMPQDVYDWFVQNIPDNKVARFLKGDEMAREPIESPSLIDSPVEEWVVTKILQSSTMGIAD